MPPVKKISVSLTRDQWEVALVALVNDDKRTLPARTREDLKPILDAIWKVLLENPVSVNRPKRRA